MSVPTEQMISRAEDVSNFLKLISNPNRLMIVCHLMDGEFSVSEIEQQLGITQPGLSRELGRLRDAGVIEARRQSKIVFYSLVSNRMRGLIDAICRSESGTSIEQQPRFAPKHRPQGSLFPQIHNRRSS